MQEILILILGAVTAGLTYGQLSIPPRELGYVYKDGQAGAQVKLAAYIDLTCPDSKASLKTLKQVADQFQNNQVQLKVYLFSLSFHRHSHTISKAANALIANKFSQGVTVYDWFQTVYDNIDSLSTLGTFNESDAQVLDFLASLAYNVTGISTADFKAGVSNTDIDQRTRLEWKYGCTRGIYGTPTFSVNDVFVNADVSWTVSQWADLINKLLGNKT